MTERVVAAAADTLIAGLAAPECPRWHDGRLYFSDMHGGGVFVLDDAGLSKVADVSGTPAGLGWLPDGSLLVVAQRERRVYRLRDGLVSVHADLSESCSTALNDMWVLPSGQAYVGEMGFDIHGFLEAARGGRTDGPEFAFARIFVVDATGEHRPGCDAIFMFPNGIVPGPAPDTLLIAESFGFKVTICDIAADGTLKDTRTWAQLDFAPDGIALDADGHLWIADPNGRRAVLIAEGGQVLHTVSTNDLCLSVALSGTDLYLCTTPDTDPVRSVALSAARIEVVPVDVGGR